MKKSKILLLVLLLVLFPFVFRVVDSIRKEGQIPIVSGNNNRPAIASNSLLAQSEAAASNRFEILSDQLTATGRIVRVMKNGVEKSAFIPPTMQISAEQLEATLFAEPKVPKPVKPTDVLESHLSFYGRVLDNMSNGIAGASVETMTLVMVPGKNAEQKKNHLLSASDGSFSVEEDWGQQLTIKVKKNGYIDAPFQVFHYGNNDTSSPKHIPNPADPVTFILHEKKTSESLFSFSMGQGLPHEGTPVRFDLTTGTIVATGGDLIVSINCPERYDNSKKTPWSLSVRVENGGLIQAHPVDQRIENMLEAPATAYENGFQVEYGPDTPEYKRQHDGLYYLTSRNGQIYAKLRITMNTYWDERGVPFGIRAVVNTNASRYLHLEP